MLAAAGGAAGVSGATAAGGAAGAGVAAQTGTLARIKREGTVRMGYIDGAAPFSFNDGNLLPQGYSVDICRAVAEGIRAQLGLAKLTTRWVALTIQNRIEAVRKKSVDVECSTTTWTLSRQALVDFSLVTFLDGGSILVRAEAERSLRYGQQAAIVLIDVHGLRRINDSEGQVSGDRVLTVFVEVIRRRLRKIDSVARYGGDEFALLLPHTDAPRALRVVDRLHQAIAAQPFQFASLQEPVRFCAGVSVVPDDAVDADTAIALADFALHEARSSGPGFTVRFGVPERVGSK